MWVQVYRMITQDPFTHDIRQTSLQAYTEHQDSGEAESQRLRILHFLKRYPDGLLRAEISSLMDIQINAVCGRIKELLKFGTVYEDEKRVNMITNKLNLVVKAR